MRVFKNGKYYHYEFQLDGRRHRGSTGMANKQQAINEERRQRERLQKTYGQILEDEARAQRRKTILAASDQFLADYKLKRFGHVRGVCSSARLRSPRRSLGRG